MKNNEELAREAADRFYERYINQKEWIKGESITQGEFLDCLKNVIQSCIDKATGEIEYKAHKAGYAAACKDIAGFSIAHPADLAWRPIKTAPKQDYVEVDLWMQWDASPMTMGMADAFRVIEAYRKEGKWVHRHEGREKELHAEYITHWMPIPKPPNENEN